MSCSSTPSSATGCAPRSRRRRQTPGMQGASFRLPFVVNRWFGASLAGRSSRWARPVVASELRVREVADPKCRCAGAGRPRWTRETLRSALPGSRNRFGARLPVPHPHFRSGSGEPVGLASDRPDRLGLARIPRPTWTQRPDGSRGPAARAGASRDVSTSSFQRMESPDIPGRFSRRAFGSVRDVFLGQCADTRVVVLVCHLPQ